MDTLAILTLLCLGLTYGQRPLDPDALYNYVNSPDPNYSWQVLDTIQNDGFTSYIINMTSQQWFDETFSDRSIWWHYVAVHIPDVRDPRYANRAMMWVSTGNNEDGVPDMGTRHVNETGYYAKHTGMVTGVIRQIPNQPIQFVDALTSKTEDTIIAWLWRRFLDIQLVSADADPVMLLRFPMCKAVSRAMDTLTTLVAQQLPGVTIERFMVGGESKRGWTTWLMPAADDRVEAITPVVLSMLNLNTQAHKYWKSMGGWTFAYIDYYVEEIPKFTDHPVIFDLIFYIDPYSYLDKLSLPKLMISGASDEFFMMDDYDYFFDDMPGEKYIWLCENTGHGIDDGPLADEYLAMVETFHVAVINNDPIPKFSWTREVDPTTGAGTLRALTSDNPSSVVVWMTDTPATVEPRRDFRLEERGNVSLGEDAVSSTGIMWYEYPATDMGGGVYQVTFDLPPTGYRAYYIKMTFPYDSEGRYYILTTQAQVLSFDKDVEFPYPDCTGESCMGQLV